MELPMLSSPAERLRWAAAQRGISSAAELHKAVGGSDSTVRAHFNGTRNFSKPNAKAYGERLGISWQWLLLGIADVATDFDAPASPVDAPSADMGDDQISEVIAILDVARGGKLPRQARSDLIARARQMLSLHPTGKR